MARPFPPMKPAVAQGMAGVPGLPMPMPAMLPKKKKKPQPQQLPVRGKGGMNVKM